MYILFIIAVVMNEFYNLFQVSCQCGGQTGQNTKVLASIGEKGVVSTPIFTYKTT